ncbi:MAG: 1-(5-phosphoribosyl)-5-amino-4-imidazole-carboxylate carboxylase, partial [Planctomycetes bacterium]|nr:1-(5-phosphoribosyl)-5-amino-4-imidazole-carboxylate carboxylase [Planctomycetota bacterium]
MTPNDERLRALLAAVQRGERDVETALAELRAEPLPPAASDLGFATVDHERARRCGFPEVVFCSGKTPADAAAIAVEILAHADRVLLTRAGPEHA